MSDSWLRQSAKTACGRKLKLVGRRTIDGGVTFLNPCEAFVMAVPDLAQFTQHVLKSRLVDRESVAREVQAFRKAGGEQSARRLARQLIEADLLTKYQARRLLAGRTEGFFLGDCRILDRLGKGGMGVVYLAEQQKLQRRVALKVLPFRPDFQSDVLQRFQREARAAAQLKHANIVQVYDIGYDRDTHFIVMEYVCGDTLAELIRRQGCFSAAQTVPLIRQAAQGLAHAHRHGVIHRDIKPSNLMLEGNTLKILDLGLARMESDEQLTGDRSIMGTLDYMSPEQCEGTRHVDHRSDLYSLGCTWFHLLSGNAPLADRRGTAKLLGHLADLLPSITAAAPDTPSEVVEILQRLTSHDRDRRFQSATELLDAMVPLDHLWDQQTCVNMSPPAAVRTSGGRASGDPETPLTNIESDLAEGLAAEESGNELTLVHRRTVGVGPITLISVMAALVLGGVYLGIQLLKDRLSGAETIVIEVPANPADHAPVGTASDSDSTQQGAGTAKPDRSSPQPANDEPMRETSALTEAVSHSVGRTAKVAAPPADSATATALQTDSPSTTDNGSPAPTVLRQPSAKPQRAPQEFILRDLSADWTDDLTEGDTLTLLDRDVFRLQDAVSCRHSITVQGTSRQRAVVYFDSQSTDFFWQQSGGALTLKHIDLYLDVADRPNRFDVFQLKQADLSLLDCSVTILSSDTKAWPSVTLISASEDRPWDPTQLGEAPPPVRVTLTHSLLRGVGATIRNTTSRTRVELSDSVVVSNGALFHQYHEVPHDYDHQRIDVHVSHCAFDSTQALVRIDCRPPTLAPPPMSLHTDSSVLTCLAPANPVPDLVFWSTGVESSTIATSFSYVGQNNIYVNRTAGLKGKATDSTVHRYVEGSSGWEIQQLGSDRGSVVVGLRLRGAVRSMADQTPRAYLATTLLGGRRDLPMSLSEVGPNIRTVVLPKRLPASLK